MVGYPLDKGEANCKLASEMKLDAFAITLSPTDKTFNVDAENINGGFPVLKWQGGRAPQVTQDAEDVAADKAALTVTPTTVTSAGKLELASTGAKGSIITWKSSKPAIIADDGTVTLPTNNDVTVILTATITKNGVSDMKEFTLTVRTAASADKAALEAIVAKLGTRFRVAYQTGDVNVLDTVRAKLADAITASGASLTADQITVTLADKGKTSLGAGTLIDDSGKVTYYYEDPSQSSIGTGDARVNGVTFTLSTANEVSVTTGSCMVSIPWDRAKVTEAMTAAAETLTFGTIKGENETSTAVTKTLTLPRTLESCGWSTISWTSSSVVVTVEDKGPLTPAEGTIHPNEEATAAKLTATFTFNKNIDDYNKDVEAPITVTRTIEVTIPGAAKKLLPDAEEKLVKAEADYKKVLADELAKLLAANGGSFETTNENARLVLALTALGQNAKAYTVGGETYDLVTPLTAKTGSAYKATVPGTTSAAFAIIAIDSAPYTVADTAAVPAMIQYLLSMQNPSGAWKINNDNPADNVDATAMVLTALAPHKSENGVQDAIDKALTYLEGLTGYGNACTDAQLVTAYSALGIDCTDAKYARGGKNPLTSLLSYQTASGGFSLDSTASNARVSPRPTEQAAYALVAYDRFKRGVKSLYDMSDAVDLLPAASGAADVAAKITALGTVTDCKRETYLALQEIEAAYAGLTAEERAEVTNYGTFLQRKQTFQTLLEAYRKAKLAELDAYYDKLKRTDYTTDQWTKITEAYRTGRSSISSAQYAEQADAALKQAKADIDAYVNGDTIEVSFRLIGDFPESYTGKHLGYVTWIETETYTVKKGSTVYDVFTEALQDAGLTSTGAASGYVRSITAPSILGGYTLSEFDNGAGSGWMFTVNGTHGNYALDEHVLQNGDRIVWHYVDNYATETSTWLTAADISPAEYARRHIGDVVTAGKHGKAAPVLTLSDLGRTVKFIFTPDKGCHVKDVKVNGKSIGAVESYTCSSLKIYDRITVEFTDGTLPFTDVRETDWFYDDVVFAYENGLFSGTTATTFSPYAPMTRAMLVTVLYRLEGEPAVTGRSGFSDVTIGSYYEAAVTWAADNGIVNGTSAVTFSPSENVTREQMAAILCRYAQYKQYGTSASASLSAFSDAAAVSTYAKAPLSWAVAEKLVNGTDGKLLPRASATRAQVAAILHRFVENITK
ncbi:MAG: DUF4430 domain-containing protein [Oscillospiraceae bacterium]|nr:DUF4430 domain-containing protein [Oscillospiraceae bacterium]